MKKRFRGAIRLPALVLSATLLLGVVCVRGSAAEENAGLPDAFLSYLTENVKQGVESVDVSQFGITYSDEVKKAIASFLFEESVELFNLRDPIGYSFFGTGELAELTLHYNCTPSEYAERLRQVEEAADGLLYGIRGNGDLSEAQKALLLHDRLAVHCEYDTGVYESAGAGPDACDIYGALAERRAVCEGYARAYLYLLRQVGIESVITRSETLDHSWNIVCIDGVPYHVDVTFDDPLDDKTGQVLHEHFLLSSDALYAANHAASDYDTSPTDTRYDDYFWQRSNAAFVLAGGSIYYVDSVDGVLNRFDGQRIKMLNNDWNGWYERGKYDAVCLSRLASDGVFLFYNDLHSVWKCDPATGKSETVFTPMDATGQKLIFGMTWENGTFICDFTDSLNNYEQGKKSFQVTKAYAGTAAAVQTGDVDGDGRVTSGDARLALRASVKLENIASGTGAFKAADADRDGVLTSADARLILRASVGLEQL